MSGTYSALLLFHHVISILYMTGFMTPIQFSDLDLSRAVDFDTYLQKMQEWVAQGATSGPVQSESLIQYTKLNLARMERQLKTIQLLPEQEVLEGRLRPMEWVVITESWCGDAAQTLPLMHITAKFLHIPMHLVLRDEHPELIERYHTNGAHAIPKLVMFDRETGEELAVWGPRPEPAQTMVLSAKQAGIPHDDYLRDLHTWYGRDKNLTLQTELVELLMQFRRTA
ncbi:MAG: thioredoxin family protein [Chitinophagales bacterium]|nr:thioredoxin family protein [Chitinophagales bacterium]MCB9022850.1 thioredoxin family protein [Chitinophagales bacterium]HPE98107.1 thioredoxin family protein [Chitinophagales bacterium]HPR29241.1 thioredoxin family protein [Chitinophagales bacterium]HQU39415.1 thioredoxin family protein [Chitinophagales bacterium]